MNLTSEHGEMLLAVAHDAISFGLEHDRAPDIQSNDYVEPLRERRASFVTLRIDGSLRGCVGGLEPRYPLVEDVAVHAFAAAFSDSRFPRLGADELALVELHVSVLSVPEPMGVLHELELMRRLRPGIDGLIIELDGQRATFLPSVWESLGEAGRFLAQLKQKAGIPATASSYSAWRYVTEDFPA